MSEKQQFDHLAKRFSCNIYDTLKGRMRLELLQQDLSPLRNGPVLTVLDAGGGMGQMSRWFAAPGHRVLLCDSADAMIQQARKDNAEQGLSEQIALEHAALESFLQQHRGRYDLVLCHAVLEWVDSPLALLQGMVEKLHPGAHLSLMFYNRHALVLKNLLRGNFHQVKRDDWSGDGGTLTPTNPLDPEDIYRCLDQLPVTVRLHAGVRCIYDYLPQRVRDGYAFDDLLEMEQMHRQQLPYRQMARYIHLLVQRDAE